MGTLLNTDFIQHFIIFTEHTQMAANIKITFFLAFLYLASSSIFNINPHEIPLDILVHLEGIGDRHGKQDQWVGTKGESRRLEGFSIRKDFFFPQVVLEYFAHLEGVGDTTYVYEGQFVGTRGQSRRLEGFSIRLIGIFAHFYDIVYQAHLQGIGDTQQYRNGDFCGTRGESRRVEAIKVRLVRR